MRNSKDLNISLDSVSNMPVWLLQELHRMVEDYNLDRDWTYLTALTTKIFLS